MKIEKQLPRLIRSEDDEPSELTATPAQVLEAAQNDGFVTVDDVAYYVELPEDELAQLAADVEEELDRRAAAKRRGS